MNNAQLLETREGNVVVISVNRPQNLNALNGEIAVQLHARIETLGKDLGVRAIILTGAGERSFVAGADITQFLEAQPPAAEQLAILMQRLHDAIRQCPKPVIASINGHCLGAGLELALACDIRIAADSARFGLPEITLGVLPGGGGTIRLTHTVGSSVARSLILTGEIIDANRALSLGIVTSLHPQAELAAKAMSLGKRLASFSSMAVSQIKKLMDIAPVADLITASQAEASAFALCFATGDPAEGAQAFLEKREAKFT